MKYRGLRNGTAEQNRRWKTNARSLDEGLLAGKIELKLELIQTQMAQKPMLRAEVYANAMRASQNRKKGSA